VAGAFAIGGGTQTLSSEEGRATALMLPSGWVARLSWCSGENGGSQARSTSGNGLGTGDHRGGWSPVGIHVVPGRGMGNDAGEEKTSRSGRGVLFLPPEGVAAVATDRAVDRD
jgi:hypothetical protein